MSLETLKALASALEVNVSEPIVREAKAAGVTDVRSRIDEHTRQREELEREEDEIVTLLEN